MKYLNKHPILTFFLCLIFGCFLCREEIFDIVQSLQQNYDYLKLLVFIILAIFVAFFTKEDGLKLGKNLKKQIILAIIVVLIIFLSLICIKL